MPYSLFFSRGRVANEFRGDVSKLAIIVLGLLSQVRCVTSVTVRS